MANENGQTGGPLVVQNEAAGNDFLNEIVPSYAFQHVEVIREYRDKLQTFTGRLNSPPPLESIDKTPDGNAFTILISHIETTLDEFFFGLWETYDFKWSVISNEVVGSLTLEVTHPVSGQKLRRTGAASIIIMVNKAPDDIKDPLQKSRWATNAENKKANALDMGFPKLKAECLKNAAQSFGKLFGRDLNRKKADTFKGLQRSKGASATAATEDALKNKNS